VTNLVEIGQTAAEIDFWIFPPYRIGDACVWTTHEGNLVVFITVQNLVGNWNRYSSFDDMQVLLFSDLGLKTLFATQNWGFGGLDPLNGKHCHRDPKKALPCAETRHMMYTLCLKKVPTF